ncbi:MAG: hypothetical protein EBX92_05210 [Actinobacteria bacterium]|nr:hypothetical protein [Actinomycetota bacterium]
MGEANHTAKPRSVVIDIPDGLENTEIIKAAYAVSDLIDIEILDKSRQCRLTRIDGRLVTDEDVFHFRREMYDYHLRKKIRDETYLERMLILSAAFNHLATPEE